MGLDFFFTPSKQTRSFVQKATVILFSKFHSAAQKLYFKKQFLHCSRHLISPLFLLSYLMFSMGGNTT